MGESSVVFCSRPMTIKIKIAVAVMKNNPNIN
jgi:hypothetical protein